MIILSYINSISSITPQVLTTHINLGSQPTWLADSLQFSERVAAVAVMKDDFSVVTRCYPPRSQRLVLKRYVDLAVMVAYDLEAPRQILAGHHIDAGSLFGSTLHWSVSWFLRRRRYLHSHSLPGLGIIEWGFGSNQSQR
jgi:hypothetical protein